VEEAGLVSGTRLLAEKVPTEEWEGEIYVRTLTGKTITI